MAKPLFVDTDIKYEIISRLKLNNSEARIQPTLTIHRGCPCQQNAGVDLQNLIKSRIDQESSESDSFIDEILCDIHKSSTSHADDNFSSYCSAKTHSSTDGYQMDMLLTGIIPLSNNVTPDKPHLY